MLKQYSPVAVYFQDADCLEYLRQDVPAVYRRIDDFLTIVLSMESRDLIGFKFKGFRNFYLRTASSNSEIYSAEFNKVVDLVTSAIEEIGEEFFAPREKKKAYEAVIEMAREDNILIGPLAKIA